MDGSTVVRRSFSAVDGVAGFLRHAGARTVFLLGSFDAGALFTTLMVPQIVRMDLREDLAHLEWLKLAWPVRRRGVTR